MECKAHYLNGYALGRDAWGINSVLFRSVHPNSSNLLFGGRGVCSREREQQAKKSWLVAFGEVINSTNVKINKLNKWFVYLKILINKHIKPFFSKYSHLLTSFTLVCIIHSPHVAQSLRVLFREKLLVTPKSNWIK